MAFGPRPIPVRLSRKRRRELERLVAKRNVAHWLALRASMILLLERGDGPTAVARQLRCSDRVVRKWRQRWLGAPCVESLREADRPGGARKFPISARCEVVELACTRPKDLKVPFCEVWTQESLAETLFHRTGIAMSRSTVQRILSAQGFRPHRVRQWLHSQDPDFRAKVQRVCNLYLSPPPGAVVLSIDEKPMQALERKHPSKTSARDATTRREFEYIRHGTSVLLAALEVHTGRVVGEVVPHRSAEALVEFMERLARRYPRKQVHVVWDNLNIHYDGKDERWQAFNARVGGRFHFVHTPLHASWVNQIEIWFSILQRRVLRHGSFESLADLSERVVDFIAYWNAYKAHPFRWTFSGSFVETAERRAA